MNIDELEALAKDVMEWNHICDDPGCSCREALDNFIAAANPETILALIDLLREMVSNLEESVSYTSCETWSPSLTEEINATLQKYKEMTK